MTPALRSALNRGALRNALSPGDLGWLRREPRREPEPGSGVQGAPVLVWKARRASSPWRTTASRRTAGQVRGHQEVGTRKSLPHEVA